MTNGIQAARRETHAYPLDEWSSEFVKRCASAFGLTGRWGFQYATTCSQARVNAFGGGAHVLDLATGETVDWIYSGSWLEIILDGGDPYA